MKYDSFCDYGDGKKYYRDCVKLDLKKMLIDEGKEDEIIEIAGVRRITPAHAGKRLKNPL